MTSTGAAPERVTVHLEPDDLQAAYVEGRRRDNSRSWSRNYAIDAETTHIRGLKGEIAFARCYGLSPDLSERPAGDGGVDVSCWWFVFPVSVDVKTTQYVADPWLRVRADCSSHADVYVLAAVADDGVAVDLVGWATRHDVTDTPPTRTETGHHTNHILKAQDLRALPDPMWVAPPGGAPNEGV